MKSIKYTTCIAISSTKSAACRSLFCYVYAIRNEVTIIVIATVIIVIIIIIIIIIILKSILVQSSRFLS